MNKLALTLALACASTFSAADQILDSVNGYVDAWSIEDNSERLAHLNQFLAADISFHDKFVEDTVIGVDGVNNMIGGFISMYKDYDQWPIITVRTTAIDRITNEQTSVMFQSSMSFEGDELFSSTDYVEFDASGKISMIRGFTRDFIPKCLDADWQAGSYAAGAKVTHRRATYQALAQTDEAPSVKAETWQKLNACSKH